MKFDYYAFLAEQKTCKKKLNECGLASGFADKCLVWFCSDCGEKNEARPCYMKPASGCQDLKLPPDLNLEPDFSQLPHSSWLGIEVEFTLRSPWYSRDDRPFHVLDNPVRKDRVFGVPFMSAASWKGLLRWACRMKAGLYGDLEKHRMKMSGWKDPAWIVYLFGNEREEGKKFSRGALQFYPTWFDKVGFEVINPHKRTNRAGTKPIYYEVCPAGTKGCLRLLYAPLPGTEDKPVEVIAHLFNGLTALLETYGISAKRTAGWGAVEIKPVDSKSKAIKLHMQKGSWFEKNLGEGNNRKYVPPGDTFKKCMDGNGKLLPDLMDKKGKILSKTQFKKLRQKKPDCTNAEFENFKSWYQEHGEAYQNRLKGTTDSKPSPETLEKGFNSLADIRTTLEKVAKGGTP